MTTLAIFGTGRLRRAVLCVTLAGVLALAGCSGVDSDTAKRTGVGTAIGAIGGTAVGAATGNYLTGAVIGAGVGAAGGFIYDQYKKAQEEYTDPPHPGELHRPHTPVMLDG